MGVTVLIVDHQTDLADSFARALAAADFDCMVAYDIDNALALIDSKQPQVVISDVKFPTGDGFEIARHARRVHPEILVVLMTASDAPAIEKQARQAGAAGYLRKPLSNAQLVSNIRSVLSSWRSS